MKDGNKEIEHINDSEELLNKVVHMLQEMNKYDSTCSIVEILTPSNSEVMILKEKEQDIVLGSFLSSDNSRGELVYRILKEERVRPRVLTTTYKEENKFKMMFV